MKPKRKNPEVYFPAVVHVLFHSADDIVRTWVIIPLLVE